MSLLNKKRQLAAAVGTEGLFTGGSIVAANAAFALTEGSAGNFEVGRVNRNRNRETLGRVASLVTTQIGVFRFSTELKGSGVGGTAPTWGVLLRACGFSETVQAGAAVIGAAVADPRNFAQANVPTMGGTFVGPRNGILGLTIIALVTDTSIQVNAEFFPDDGSANYEQEDAIQSVAGATALAGTQLTGVTFDFGDPSTSTTGFQVGDRYYVGLTSDQSNQVIYKPISASIPVLDMTFIEDGRAKKLHSCRGTARFVAALDAVPVIEWEFRGVIEETLGVVAQALLTGIAYEDVVPSAFVGVASTLHGVEPECYTNATVDLGNTLTPRLCSKNVKGVTSVRITDRNVTGSINPEAVLPATFNAHAKLLAGTIGNLSLQIGTVAGNKVTLAATRLQIENVDDVDRDGLIVDALEFGLNEPEFDAGDVYDEFTVTTS